MADDPFGWFNFKSALGGAGSVTALGLLLGFLDRWWNRKDKLEDRQAQEEEHARSQLDGLGIAVFDRMNKEIARKDLEIRTKDDELADLRTIITELRRDADQKGDISQAWKWRCHQLKHEVDNAHGAVSGAEERMGRAPVEWMDESLPELDAIKEDNAAYAIRRRQWYLDRRNANPKPGA